MVRRLKITGVLPRVAKSDENNSLDHKLALAVLRYKFRSWTAILKDVHDLGTTIRGWRKAIAAIGTSNLLPEVNGYQTGGMMRRPSIPPSLSMLCVYNYGSTYSHLLQQTQLIIVPSPLAYKPMVSGDQ